MTFEIDPILNCKIFQVVLEVLPAFVKWANTPGFHKPGRPLAQNNSKYSNWLFNSNSE